MEFLSPEEYAAKDFAEAVEHINHAKGLVLKEVTQRRLFGLWCYAMQGAPPLIPPTPSTSSSKLEQYEAWLEIAASQTSKESAAAAYVSLVTTCDPNWRNASGGESVPVPTHLKSQLLASGIRLVDTSSSSEEEDYESDSSDSTSTSDTEIDTKIKKALITPPVASIFEAAKVGSQRIQMFLPTHANDEDPETGVSVLMSAVDAEQLEMVRILISAGANVNWVDPEDKSTPLHCASLLGNLNICQALLAAGAEVVVEDEDGMTPLEVACREKHSEELLTMLK